MKTIIAITFALLLAACQKAGVKPTEPPVVVRMPETVERAVKVPVYVDPALAADCYNETVKAQTYEEAKRLALLRNRSINECNKRLQQIRERHGGKKP